MSHRIIRLLAACALLALPLAQAGAKVGLGEKAMLQAAMQAHIDRSTVDGKFLHVESGTGEVKRLRARSAHPIILEMGEFFVLCSDFEAANGNAVNVDFYLARKGNGYVVFDQTVGEREQVKRLMKAGKAKRVD